METFSALLAICAGNSPVPVEFPTQRPVTRSFGVFFDLRPNKRLNNNREDGDLRRHSAHYDVIAMRYTERHCYSMVDFLEYMHWSVLYILQKNLYPYTHIDQATNLQSV